MDHTAASCALAYLQQQSALSQLVKAANDQQWPPTHCAFHGIGEGASFQSCAPSDMSVLAAFSNTQLRSVPVNENVTHLDHLLQEPAQALGLNSDYISSTSPSLPPVSQDSSHILLYFTGPPVSSVQTALQAAHLRETGLGLSVLDRIVLQLADCGIAESIKKVYESGQRRFLTLCQQHGRNPLPTTEVLLCRFVAFLAAFGLSYGSVRSYISLCSLKPAHHQ